MTELAPVTRALLSVSDKIKIQGGSLKGVKVTKDGSDTIVKFDQGTIRLENTDLTKSKIDFVF